MDRIRFNELRGNVLEKFNNLEMMMNLIISMYYFNRIEKDFVFRVLHDSFFSFALRMSIFMKIIKDIDKKRINRIDTKIRNMSSIRNYFAHISPQYFDSEEPSFEKMGYSPHPKDPKKKIDFEKEHEEFFELEKEVLPYVLNACKVLGVTFPVKF